MKSILTPSRDENVQLYVKYFPHTQGSLLSTGLHLVIQDDDQVCHLGTFDGDHLVSYVSLHNTGEYWQVDMQCTHADYLGQGYVRNSIETAIQMFGCVISRRSQTPEDQRTWRALILRPNLYAYYLLNLRTTESTPFRVSDQTIAPNPWDQTDCTVILACDRQLTESSMRRMAIRQKIDNTLGRPDRWLGPGFTEFNP